MDIERLEAEAGIVATAPERRRVAPRFEEAFRLAEQAFATEFARLLAHLTERLATATTANCVCSGISW